MEKRHYTFQGADFLLEPISDSVIRVTHVDQVGYVGMSPNWNPHRPYVWATSESQVGPEGIMTFGASFEYRTVEEALQQLCGILLDAQRRREAQRVNPEERKAAGRRLMREFLAELPGEGPPDSGRRTEAAVDEMEEVSKPGAVEDRYVSVRLADLCRLANSVGTMMHDLENGKRKYLHEEIDKIHEVVEEWASDAAVLGGGCHDHRCRRCREWGIIYSVPEI